MVNNHRIDIKLSEKRFFIGGQRLNMLHYRFQEILNWSGISHIKKVFVPYFLKEDEEALLFLWKLFLLCDTAIPVTWESDINYAEYAEIKAQRRRILWKCL